MNETREDRADKRYQILAIQPLNGTFIFEMHMFKWSKSSNAV
jgi:hypothetical protein